MQVDTTGIPIMNRSSKGWRHAAWAGLFCAVLTLAGCTDTGNPETGNATNADDHGHSHEEAHGSSGPKTLADAITQLTGLRNVIRDGFAAGDDDAAHGPLHDVGHCLEAVEKLAATEKAGTVEAATIKTQVDVLFKAYGDVDKTMHGKEGRSYSEVSKEIDDAFVALLAAAGVKDPSAKPAADAGDDASADSTAPATETPAVDVPASDAPAAEPETSAAPAADATTSDAPPAEPEKP
jgi:hypothetical protein